MNGDTYQSVKGSGSLASDTDHDKEILSLVDILARHLRSDATRVGFTYLDYGDGNANECSMSYGQLDRRARAIAAVLMGYCRPGDRALLLYPAGTEYICAFFGCLYAGVIAVPAYPPFNPRLQSRLEGIADNCGATIALNCSGVRVDPDDLRKSHPRLARIHWINTEEINAELAHLWCRPDIGRDTVAFLQYTSGSTSMPKGVIVTHGNLLANLDAIERHFGFTPRDHHVTWLPPYHDMGLIGALMGSFYTGFPVTIMSPMAFLRRPERWLSEISRRGATISGAPNFAYELCAEKVDDTVIEQLNLSGWEIAFSGSEPVRADTIDRFSRRFARCGFRRQAFYPCYGLAEATLLVSGVGRGRGPSALDIDTGAYAQSTVVESTTLSEKTIRVVSCGTIPAGLEVEIIDVRADMPVSEGGIGEIIVSGESICHEYWNNPAASLEVFQRRSDGARVLRTGDLGFLHKQELYIAGRLKDVLIISGINYYPQDLEATVGTSHPGLRRGCGIVFAPSPTDGSLVVVHEIRKRDQASAEDIFRSIRASLWKEHGVGVTAVILIEPGTIPKTTSGKLARQPCRKAFFAGELQTVSAWYLDDRFALSKPDDVVQTESKTTIEFPVT